MSQGWWILNIDRKEKSGEMDGHIGLSMATSATGWMLCAEVEEWLADGPMVIQPGPFGKLSTELLDMIFDALPEFRDIAFLSLTCKRLLDTGCRLICIGDYSTDADLPEGVLTDEERQEKNATKLEDLDDDDKDRLFAFAEQRYTKAFGHEWPRRSASSERYLGTCEILRQSFPRHLRRKISSDVERWETLCTRDIAGHGPVVLCNISKAEYVRADGLVGHDDFHIGHALLPRICWSNPSTFYKLEDCMELGRGPGAGDRFCITTLGALPDVLEGQEWSDVTEEIDALLVEIWNETEEWNDRKEYLSL
ncbi:hypothetical protein C8T65DRAFT_833464 [Cerioporus squamosus]|nr:hypothetical protein C8T65DRAFT_833464 [Cerioporus squamosus]